MKKQLVGFFAFLALTCGVAFGQAYVSAPLAYPQARSTAVPANASAYCVLAAPGLWGGVISLDGATAAGGPWTSIGSLNVPGTLPIVVPTGSPVPTYFSVSGIFTSGATQVTASCIAPAAQTTPIPITALTPLPIPSAYGGTQNTTGTIPSNHVSPLPFLNQNGNYPTGPATILSSAYDVRAYGAACDGSTDDHVAIQAALTAANSAGGTLYFPAGKNCVYNSATPLNIQNGTTVYGVGATLTGGGSTTDAFVFVNTNGGYAGITNPVQFLPNISTFTSGACIRVETNLQYIVANTIYNCQSGLVFDSESNNEVLDNTVSIGQISTTTYATSTYGDSTGNIEGNVVTVNFETAQTYGLAFRIKSPATSYTNSYNLYNLYAIDNIGCVSCSTNYIVYQDAAYASGLDQWILNCSNYCSGPATNVVFSVANPGVYSLLTAGDAPRVDKAGNLFSNGAFSSSDGLVAADGLSCTGSLACRHALSSGVYTWTFGSSPFGVTPVCTATEESVTGHYLMITAISSTAVTVTSDVTSSNSDNADIMCVF